MKTKKLKLEKLQITKLKNSHSIIGGDIDDTTVKDEKRVVITI